jgi:acetyl-CoA carboxylase beta subunit
VPQPEIRQAHSVGLIATYPMQRCGGILGRVGDILAEEKKMIQNVLQLEKLEVLPVEKQQSQVIIPKNIIVKCPKCKELLYERDFTKNLKVCLKCNHHFRLTAYERIELLVDPGSFVELDADIISANPLQFVSQSRQYAGS